MTNNWRSKKSKDNKTQRFKVKRYYTPKFAKQSGTKLSLPLTNLDGAKDSAIILLTLFNKEQERKKKLAIKRATVSAANTSKAQGNEDVSEIYRKMHKIMVLPKKEKKKSKYPNSVTVDKRDKDGNKTGNMVTVTRKEGESIRAFKDRVNTVELGNIIIDPSKFKLSVRPLQDWQIKSRYLKTEEQRKQFDRLREKGMSKQKAYDKVTGQDKNLQSSNADPKDIVSAQKAIKKDEGIVKKLKDVF